MKKGYIILTIFILNSFSLSFSQSFKGNIWCFGDSSGIDWINPSSPTFFKSASKGRGGTVSICDSTGNLIMYAYGQALSLKRTCAINKYHKLMQFGDSIYSEELYNELLLLPLPQNDSLFYLFSIGVVNPNSYGLFYSILNYKANNDSGIVVQKNIQLNNLPAFDGLTAVRHGNGRDWWIVFKRYKPNPPIVLNNDLYVYLLDSAGVSGPSIQSVGNLHLDGGGHLLFNESGLKATLVTFNGVIEFFDFDRCNGVFSNPVIVQGYPGTGIGDYYGSCALSPDESKLYISAYTQYSTSASSVDTLFQFDLNAPDIMASKTVIFNMPNDGIGIGILKMAPDNKIYLASTFENYYPYQDTSYNVYNTYLSVINQPDSLGLACDFQPFSFYLGGARTYYGLPNNPDYELGAWVGSPCDTLTVGINENDEKNDVFFQAWYNQEWNMIHVNASKLKGKGGVLRLFDVEGRVVYERKVDVISGGYFTGEVMMNGIVSGVYIVSLTTEKDKVQGKILKF